MKKEARGGRGEGENGGKEEEEATSLASCHVATGRGQKNIYNRRLGHPIRVTHVSIIYFIRTSKIFSSSDSSCTGRFSSMRRRSLHPGSTSNSNLSIKYSLRNENLSITWRNSTGARVKLQWHCNFKAHRDVQQYKARSARQARGPGQPSEHLRRGRGACGREEDGRSPVGGSIPARTGHSGPNRLRTLMRI